MRRIITGFVALLGLALLGLSCSSRDKPPECAPAPQAAAKGGMKTTVIKRADLDWCQACVKGKRWVSCQTADAAKKGEAREILKRRAVEKACVDAEYEKDQCPDASVFLLKCRGEKGAGSAQETGEALQRALMGRPGNGGKQP